MEKIQLHGWLVVNQFLNANKYSELYDWFQAASKKYGIRLTVKTNSELIVADLATLSKEENVDFVLFWDKDIRLAQSLEHLGLPLFNASSSIEMCDDKGYTYIMLKKHGIPMPETILSPKTYERPNYNDLTFLDAVEQRLGYPMVVKECFGSFGWQVYLAENKEEVIKILKETSPKPLLFQQFISSSRGRDLRLQVVGDKVVASMKRTSTNNDFRANLTIGGEMMCYEPTKEEEALAVSACQALGLDFGGVDLLFGEDGSKLVCEVNSNAHFRNIYDCTKVNVAEDIISYINEKTKERRNG